MAAEAQTETVVFTVQHVTSPDEFPDWAAVEGAAFAGSQLRSLWYPSHDPEEILSFSAKVHEDIWRNDPSARYLTAKSPSGKIIGIAKWNFFHNSEPQHPWPKVHPPGANVKFIDSFFGSLDDARNSALKGQKHALMAILGILPEYQRMGIGGKLLHWGLARCDEEGLDCWIDASKKGKGLYLKHGWKEVGTVDVDLEEWGGEKGSTPVSCTCMLRPPRQANGDLQERPY